MNVGMNDLATAQDHCKNESYEANIEHESIWEEEKTNKYYDAIDSCKKKKKCKPTQVL